jgi:hypothetical protein
MPGFVDGVGADVQQHDVRVGAVQPIGDVVRGAGGVMLVWIGGVVGDLIVAPAALPLAVAIGQRRALRRKVGQPA